LYRQLDKLGRDRVLYCNTDSVIFVDYGDMVIETGEALGEWTDELEADDYITELLSTGPKSYYFETLKKKL
jgi:hypothetical protein